MKYSKYDLFDFVEDEVFQEWVLRSNKELDYFWESFMVNHNHKVEIISKAKNILQSIDFKRNNPSQELEDEVFKNILEEKYSKPYHDSTKVEANKGVIRTLITKITGIAATFLMLLVGYGIKLLVNEDSKQIEQIKNPVRYIEKSLAKGQKATYKFSDGTIVKLNSGSYIRFPERFDGDLREVMIEGEAYFDVAHDPLKPFLIHTGHLSTKVLGTSFNIKYNVKKDQLQVAVESGLVSVLDNQNDGINHENLLLKPDEMGIFIKDQKPMKQDFDHNKIFAWKDGVLVLEESSLPEIFEELERWYGLEFQYPENVKNVIYTGGTFSNMPLKDVLEGLSFSLKFNYSIQNNKVMITKKM